MTLYCWHVVLDWFRLVGGEVGFPPIEDRRSFTSERNHVELRSGSIPISHRRPDHGAIPLYDKDIQ